MSFGEHARARSLQYWTACDVPHAVLKSNLMAQEPSPTTFENSSSSVTALGRSQSSYLSLLRSGPPYGKSCSSAWPNSVP